MGIHHGGDGGNLPPDGEHPPNEPLDLPGLPPEWGEIRIPDDPSDLAAEAEQVRQELAEQRRQSAVSGFRPARAGGDTEPSAGVPLLIMSVAVLITLVSLFAMAWSGSRGGERADALGQPAPGEFPTGLTLMNAAGGPVTPAAFTPVAILLVEGCTDCTDLIAATAAAAPAGVTVAAIGHTAPDWPSEADPAAGAAPLLLADPNETVRAALDLDPPTNAATVILVNQDSQVVRTVPAATTIGQFQADLETL